MNADKEDAQRIIRQKVLNALDSAATEIFGAVGFNDRHGWKDEDLPALFKALDTHLDILAARFNSRLIG